MIEITQTSDSVTVIERRSDGTETVIINAGCKIHGVHTMWRSMAGEEMRHRGRLYHQAPELEK